MLTKCPALLKSAIKTAKVCSLSDDSFNAIKTANGRQFVRHLCNLVFFLLKSAIKTAKVCSLLTNPPKVLKSAIKTAKVWQFVYVATKLPPCGSLYPRKKVWIKLPRSAVLMALFKTALYWQVSPSVSYPQPSKKELPEHPHAIYLLYIVYFKLHLYFPGWVGWLRRLCGGWGW